MDFNNIEKFIRDGGNAAEIAQAFADELNKVLGRIEDEKAVDTNAIKVADTWKEFVTAYFKVHDLPKDTSIEDFCMTKDDAIQLLETFVNIVPVIVKYSSSIENFSNTIEKAVDLKVDKNSFSDTMENFFRKLKI